MRHQHRNRPAASYVAYGLNGPLLRHRPDQCLLGVSSRGPLTSGRQRLGDEAARGVSCRRRDFSPPLLGTEQDL